MRKFSFVTVDVFSTRALAGNPVAVFTDARGLADAEMQAVALETRLSETTFISPRDDATERTKGVNVRIFTISEELPFAGHPALGTAFVIANARSVNEVALDLKVGKIPVVFRQTPDGRFGEMTQRDPEFGKIHDANEVAKAIDLTIDDIDPSMPIQTVSTGFAFAIVPLRSLSALAGLQPNLAKVYAYLATTRASHFYFIVRDGDGGVPSLRARMMFYGGEDPATGSAAGCTAAWMVRHGVAKPEQEVVIAQGVEMLRPSDIYVRASLEGTRVHNVRVGGHCAEVMRGELTIP
ncbi:MAG TPA: PhzF family phenazine biosynthesis protein [Candidatus Binataceae bacterium]|nr:PhzF family phenazine biosynthesis protein [Candidatus Binataceae bacterium]